MICCRTLAGCACSAAVLLTLSVASAEAATILESDLAGGDFSNSWSAPTVIGNGYDLIQGTGDGNNFDILAFTGMAFGAQTVTLTFSAPVGIGPSYAAGGSILFSAQAFRWGWDGQSAGTFFTSLGTPTQTASINLDSSFGGSLYLGLYFTFGQNLSYSVSLPGNATPPSVPLPASVGLLAGALAGFGAMRASRRAKRHDSAKI